MVALVSSPAELPAGSHSLSLYATHAEAARNVASFLKGAEDRDQSALILTADDAMMDLYRGAVRKEVPRMLAALRRIPGSHLRPTPGGLRPLPEADVFVSAHPEGVSVCGDTIPSFLNRQTLPTVLVYESWFDRHRASFQRGLCPYDLNRIPVDLASDAFEGLARVHTHAVLSSTPDPAAQFLQLLLLPLVENPPGEHLGWLARAVDYGLIGRDHGEGKAGRLTARGETFVRALRALPAFSRTVAQVGRRQVAPGDTSRRVL